MDIPIRSVAMVTKHSYKIKNKNTGNKTAPLSSNGLVFALL